ncbi:MAG: 4-(cytidine 5'-diphospho)-2-C-methyl-D-erythritol kinase [Candidatus Omnitrophota bacterium]
MKKLVLASCAKLNLYLNVLAKRADGFHDIETVFERIDLCDEVGLKLNSSGLIRVSCLDKAVPQGARNLAFQAAEILKKDFSLKAGVDIQIKKNIPVGSGLAGGSSNAAATLLGLNQLLGLRLSRKQLLKYARILGSDVAFFVLGYRFGLGRGRGDEIKPLRGIGRFWHLLVVPSVSVSTKSIYQGLNFKSIPDKTEGLTDSNKDVKMLVRVLKDRDFSGLPRYIHNSLETETLEKFPEVGQIKDYLRNLGINTACMSGSGAAVYAILKSRKEAEKYQAVLNQKKDWQTYVVKTR